MGEPLYLVVASLIAFHHWAQHFLYVPLSPEPGGLKKAGD